jgi:hypothetical protein
MVWKDVCKRGRPGGGRVREDDVHGGTAASHDAGDASPGILKFIKEVVVMTPARNIPPKPAGFPTACRVEMYPGQSAADVHFEGRAADVFLLVSDPTEKEAGEWLFDWCVENCEVYQIQGVIFDNRQWFSEKGECIRAGHKPIPANSKQKTDHQNHVHVELNGDGAALSAAPATSSTAPAPTSPAGQWKVQVGR